MRLMQNGIYVIEDTNDEKMLLNKIKNEHYHITNINHDEFILHVNKNDYYGSSYYWESKKDSLIRHDYIPNNVCYTLKNTSIKEIIDYECSLIYEKYKNLI